MKKTIVLKTDYLDTSTMTPVLAAKKQEILFRPALKDFHQQMAEIKTFKVLRENVIRSEIVIEFPEAEWEKLYEALRAADIVLLIDSSVYEDDK